MVELLDPQPGAALLDLAAGIGETGFLALERVGPGGSLTTADVAPGMVAAAERRAAELRLDRVSFVVADAQSLPLADASYDGVLCRFGVMLVPEPRRILAEIARVLRPGGRVAFAVWADAERNDWATAGGRAALALGLIERPDPGAPGPFRLADRGRTRELVLAAGLDPRGEEEIGLEWRYASLDEWWTVTTDLSRSLRTVLAGLAPGEIAAVRDGAFARLEAHVAGDGSVAITGVARVHLAARP